MMPAIVPLRLTLLHMPKSYLHLLHLLDYIAHILLNTFVWMHTPQHIHYSLNILPINQLKRGLLGQILYRSVQSKLHKWHTKKPLAIFSNCHWLKNIFNGMVLALSLSIRLQMDCTTKLQSGTQNGNKKLPESRCEERVPIVESLI